MVDINQIPTRRPFHRRRKTCPFSGANAPKIDYKDVRLLQRYISERGKIVPSRITAVSQKKQRELDSLRKRIADLESRIATTEAEVKQLEAAMSAAGFYEDVTRSKPVIDRHQALMWEVGDLMAQWEALQNHAAEQATD